MRILRKRPIL
jgi:broad specificity phosphatase PhoE